MSKVEDTAQQLTVRIWRGKETGELVTYHVPARENQTVLDIVTEVQRLHAPSLAYRFACRVGVCGSCAMMVNGRPRWTCRTHVNKVASEGVLTLEPLRNLPRIKDLVCDMAPFIDTWQRAGAPFVGTRTRHDPPATVDPPPAPVRPPTRGYSVSTAPCVTAPAMSSTGAGITSARRA